MNAVSCRAGAPMALTSGPAPAPSHFPFAQGAGCRAGQHDWVLVACGSAEALSMAAALMPRLWLRHEHQKTMG